MRETYLFLVELLSLVQCLEDCWHDNEVPENLHIVCPCHNK